MELLILSIPGMYKDRWYLLQVPNKQVLTSKSSTADLTSFSPSLNSSNSSTWSNTYLWNEPKCDRRIKDTILCSWKAEVLPICPNFSVFFVKTDNYFCAWSADLDEALSLFKESLFWYLLATSANAAGGGDTPLMGQELRSITSILLFGLLKTNAFWNIKVFFYQRKKVLYI